MKKQLCAAIILLLVALIVSQNLVHAYSPDRDPEGRNLPYYLEDNISRYEAFQMNNPDIPFGKIVAYVNAGVDKSHYSDIVIVANPSDYTVFLSKNLALPSGYIPDDMVSLASGELLRTKAAAAFENMKIAARDEGLNFYVRSSYRSHGSQVASYNLVADNYGVAGAEASVARPGHSEHQTGLALDIMHKPGTTGPLTVQGFGDSEEFTWLLEHGHEYGFILRYPEEYANIHGFVYEPWHWRYVGVWVAKRMKVYDIATFEEYYGKYLAPAVLAKLRALKPCHHSIIRMET